MLKLAFLPRLCSVLKKNQSKVTEKKCVYYICWVVYSEKYLFHLIYCNPTDISLFFSFSDLTRGVSGILESPTAFVGVTHCFCYLDPFDLCVHYVP